MSDCWPTYASATSRVVAAVTKVVARAERTAVTRIAPNCAALSPVSKTGELVVTPTGPSSGNAESSTNMLRIDTGINTAS